VANLLSLSRLLTVLPFALLVARGGAANAAWAGGLFVLAIVTDLADGPLARKRGTANALGRVLDHGSDFLFVCSGLAAAAARGHVPWLLPVLVAVAFAQYVIDSYWLHRARELRMSALGRWNGILYFVPLGGAILIELGLGFLAAPNTVVAWGLVASTVASIADRALAAGTPTRSAR